MDVRAKLRDGQTVFVEMQALNEQGFERRVLYNAAKEYERSWYKMLKPVIGLTIKGFTMFQESELAKFDLDAGEPKTLLGKWLYFLKTAPDLSVVPDYLQPVPEIGRVFEVARFMNLTVEEERAMEKGPMGGRPEVLAGSVGRKGQGTGRRLLPIG